LKFEHFSFCDETRCFFELSSEQYDKCRLLFSLEIFVSTFLETLTIKRRFFFCFPPSLSLFERIESHTTRLRQLKHCYLTSMITVLLIVLFSSFVEKNTRFVCRFHSFFILGFRPVVFILT